MGGAPHDAGGQVGGVSYSVALESPAAEPEEADDTRVYEDYRPQIQVGQAKPHPTPLAESAAMSVVSTPTPTYQPKLPIEVIQQGNLSGPQLESVILAGQAHGQTLPDGARKGFFIGDGTGVGKGREIAAILWDNWNHGRRKAVWITEKAELVDDAGRDMEGVGWTRSPLFEVSKVKSGEPIKNKEGVAFITYDTLRASRKGDKNATAEESQGKGELARLKQLVAWLGPDFDGVIAFDESHNMGNAIMIRGKRGRKKPSRKALAGVQLQQQLPKARILYVSATGATEVSNLSYAGRLGLWGEGTPFSGINQFVSEIAAGGVAAMELVAQSMKSLGLYLARTLNFKGVTYDQIDHGLSPEQREVYDELAGAWQLVLENIHAALGLTGQQNNSDRKSGAMSAFWGSHQRFFNQIITAMSMPAVISRMEKYIAQGDAVVLQLVNTYEAATERQIALKRQEGGELDLESLDLTPGQQLMEMVSRLPVQQFEPVTDEHGNTEWVMVTDNAGNPVLNEEAVAMREALLARLGAIRVPESPLDMIVNTFGVDQVAEVTGRKRRIVYVERDGSRFKDIEKRSDSKAKADADAFMADQKRVLIFSEKGGTGRSYHADRKAKNQRKRRHILLQAGWRADKAIQGFGRTHRSNQVHTPEYVMVRIPEIPGQARFISSIARRLDQLGALTKGQRQTGGQGFFSARDNLESDYAKDALLLLFRSIASGEASVSLEDFQAQTGLQLVDRSGNVLADLPPITQFLNRLLSMKLDAQNKVFDDFMTRFEGIIKAEMEAGTFDQGLETLRAQRIEVLQDKEVYRHPDTGATARYVELDLEHPTKITTWNQVRARTKFGFVLNRQSGKVWAVTHRTERTAKDGSLYVEYRVESPTTANYVAAERMVDEHYEKLDEARAAKEWESAARSAPKTYKERKHLVSGTILPIWNRIKGKPKIVRVVARDGRKYLGRLIDSGRLSDVLEALGAEARASSIEPESALESVLDRGAQVTLANGWRLVRRKVSGDLRIEIMGVGLSDMDLLRRQGAIIERINWETRFFLPTGNSMLEVFKRVSLGKPIMAVEEPRLRAGLPSDPAPTDVDNSANRARHALDGGGMQINPGGNPEAGFVVNPAQLIADLAKVGVDLFNRGASTFAGWSQAMLNLFGRKVKPWLIRVWNRVTNLTRATLAGLTPEGVATVNRIEAQGDQASQPAIRPVYPDGRRDNFWRKAGRPSRRLAYFGSAALLRSKQELDLEESYQSAAVKSASDRLMAQLERSAYDANPTAWKLPRWMRTGAWARRLRLFKRLALPIAAHLNVTGRYPAGEFVFSDFEMRSGLMTVREFVRGKHTVGAVITVDNPLTGASEEMTIGNLVTLPNGRSGYQLTRQMTATQQAELYRHYADEFPEMMWLLDMYVDPDLAGVRQTVNGVQVPLFNRFSQAAMMGDTDPRFQAVEAYTPDVLVTRSLLGAVRGALGLRRGTRSPGRRYKTGASRESGGVRDLLSGHNVRTFQMLQERARRQFFQAILRTAAPIPGGVVPEGFVKLDLGMEELWQAVKRLRFWRSPRDPVTGALLFPETESRLGDDNSPEYKAFFGEAASLRGRQLMISQALLDTLLRKYAAHQTHGMLYRMGAWLVRNSTQLFLAHPKTYVANVLTNDLFAFEAAYRHAISGLVKLDARDLRYASGILAGMVLNRFKGLRELIHVADNTRYMRTVREVLPDQIFSDATQLSDVKVRYDDNWFDLLRRGELGGATLQIIHYGAIDVRAKQRMAYAYLRATAITNARRAGLRGRSLRAAVDGYMANPPMEDRARAVASANFELLNYSDSPDWLNRFSRSDYGRLVLPFPRFGYHYLAKQKSRLEAVKLLIGKVPKGQRADAFADLVTVATFGLGGAGLVFSTALRALLDLPDDEDARQHVGTSTVRFVDEDGRVKTKVIDRELVTSNRVNLSYWARAMGLDTGQDDDFWLRTRQYPVISMAGAAALAIDDARKFGPQYGVATYASTVGDLAGDFFSVGMALKVPDKALASMRSLGTGRPEKPILDPYATNVPFLAYLAEQAVDSLLPGSRQVDEVIWWLDPMVRRKTASSTLDFYPGVWDGLRAGHVTGLIDRLLSEGQSTLPPAGEIDRSAGVVANPREIPVATRVLSLGGFNVKPVNREDYEAAIAQ